MTDGLPSPFSYVFSVIQHKSHPEGLLTPHLAIFPVCSAEGWPRAHIPQLQLNVSP